MQMVPGNQEEKELPKARIQAVMGEVQPGWLLLLPFLHTPFQKLNSVLADTECGYRKKKDFSAVFNFFGKQM
jgi:hypothetical protein